jgi:amidase
MGSKLRRRDLLAAAGVVVATGAMSLSGDATGTVFAQKPDGVAPPADGLAYASTRALVTALAERRVSAVELLKHAIARIEAFDSLINAVAVRDFERAHSAAVAADVALAQGKRAPLLGVSMTVKESYNVAGLPTTWGFPRFKDWRPTGDASAVARLKAAGAVILGKTNLAIGISDWQSYNDVYGTTNNPWDLGRTPGGSSGGSAAALASGYVSLELGSDINSSLRAPAHYCGVYGHKPTFGLVPLRGHVPPNSESSGIDVTGGLAVAGPLARSAADLGLALDVLAGPDEDDAIAYRVALPPARHDKLSDFRVLVVDMHPLLPTAGEVRSAIHRLSDRLTKAGTKVANTSPLLPDLAEIARLYQQLVFSFSQAGRPPEFYRRVESAVAALSIDDKSLAAQRLRGAVLSHRDWIAGSVARGRLRRLWSELFREWDVVLCPVMPTLAFQHDHTPDQDTRHIAIDGHQYPYRDQSVWSGVATVPGLPATVAPIDRSESGLPIGIQIVGPYLEDRTTIKFAELIEREFGGFVPPPKFAG